MGGDEYLVYYNDDNATSAMVLKYEWDNDREARQFNQAFKSYASNRFGKPVVDSPGLIGWEASEGYTAFHSSGNQSTWILASDAATAEALWVALQAAG